MKKIAILLTLVTLLFAACDPQLPEEEPTEQEKRMVQTEMTWRLDSVQSIHNWREPDESSVILRPEDGIDIWSFTFYPCTYHFPDDLVFVNELSGEKLYMAKEFNKGYCKYTCTYEGTIISAGYLCYYKDYFAFSGVKQGGWVEFMIREADTNWNTNVWTCSYNAEEDYDTGAVIERCTEFYSRVK